MLRKIKKFISDWENQSSYIKWIVNYTKPYIPQLSLVMFLNIMVSLASIGLALIGKRMVDQASAGNTVTKVILLYVLIVLVSQAMMCIGALSAVVIYEQFAFRIRKQVYRRILDTNWLDVTKYHTGDLMTRLTTDVGIVADGISVTIPSILQLAVQLLATFCTLAVFDWKLAVFALAIAPAAALSSMWLGRILKKLQMKVQETESRYRSFIQESLSNILIVKSFRTEDYSVEKLTRLRDERLYWVLKKNRTGLAASTILSLAFQFGYVAAFAWGAVSISRNTITFGTMTVFLTLVNRIQSPIVNLAQSIPKLVSMIASAARIIEIQKLPEETSLEENIRGDQVGVRVNKISFGYGEDLVFDQASIDFKPGEFTAIVGASGIGKTTLVRLIMAFTNKAAGTIEFYNVHGDREKANASARDFISYVPQGNTLFSGTIRENIRMGRLDATEEEIMEALKGASADGFVSGLPKGVDTVIGEKGHGISEGQAQRIAIARALVRKAPFLILDEATSSLDEETELRVLEGIRSWNPAPTCLLITHRRSVLQYCDREICIENKKLGEVV